LHLAFVFPGRRPAPEGARIPALAGLGIQLPRIKAVPACRQFSNHSDFLADGIPTRIMVASGILDSAPVANRTLAGRYPCRLQPDEEDLADYLFGKAWFAAPSPRGCGADASHAGDRPARWLKGGKGG